MGHVDARPADVLRPDRRVVGADELVDPRRCRHDGGVLVVEQHVLQAQAALDPRDEDVRSPAVPVELGVGLPGAGHVLQVDDDPALLLRGPEQLDPQRLPREAATAVRADEPGRAELDGRALGGRDRDGHALVVLRDGGGPGPGPDVDPRVAGRGVPQQPFEDRLVELGLGRVARPRRSRLGDGEDAVAQPEVRGTGVQERLGLEGVRQTQPVQGPEGLVGDADGAREVAGLGGALDHRDRGPAVREQQG
jgi:hypothetical protein